MKKSYRAIMIYPAVVGMVVQPRVLFPDYHSAYTWSMNSVDRWEYDGMRPIGVLIWSSDTMIIVSAKTLINMRKRATPDPER